LGGGKTQWQNVEEEAKDASLAIAQMGFVRVVSAFERFLAEVEVEFERHKQLLEPNIPSSTIDRARDIDDDGLTRLLKSVYKLLSLDPQRKEAFEELTQYIILARHCVAHRAGRASPAISKLTRSAGFTGSMTSWRSRRNRPAPQLPPIVVDKEIEFLPRHSIFASSICYEVASVINARLVALLGKEGIVYSAAYYSLISDDPIRINGVKTPQALINQLLFNRYRLKDVRSSECTAILKKLNRWQVCRDRFAELYPSPIKM